MTLISANTPENEIFSNYMKYRTDLYQVLLPGNVEHSLISEANWLLRSRYASGEEMGIRVKPGDICYMDFGQSYLNEMGYQHFGLVMTVCCKKALVVPMTSNVKTYEKAYDAQSNPRGRRNLMRIGKVQGLNRESVLFLNDIRFVNTARVIDVKASIPADSRMFRQIQQRLFNILFSPE